ncbi:MAG TPA: helix-hairpin-helix domain-containing protein, partial [Solirubrobacteraceae bacterium]|nr:helix-hairpin-helix domain-containing protein [Solirubrobacteraceae bacterium]
MPMQTLAVEVMAVRFADEDFAVLAALTDEGEEVTLTGPLAHVHRGEALDVGGEWRTHPRHGRQFHVERVRARPPVGEDAVLAYLQTVKHVGPRGAEFLVARFGAERVLDEIDRDPERTLSSVPGIGPRKLAAAVRSWRQQATTRAVRLFLEEHGVPAAPAARIVKAFGAEAIERLTADPYGATSEAGIGFATADALARALGVPPDSPGRLDAGLLHALRLAEDDGHCHLPRAEREQRAARLLDAD